MKRSGTTLVFVLAWAIVLVIAYGLGVCIKEYRFRQAGVTSPAVAAAEKPNTQAPPENAAKPPPAAPVAGMPEAGPPSGPRPGFGGDRMGGGERPQLENMTEEERQQAMARMRERFGSRRRGGENMPQLSDEDRQKMMAEIEDLRNRWESMSDEERQQAQDQMRQKYGFAPRGFGGGGPAGGGPGGRSSGGDRTSGGAEGGRGSSEGSPNGEGQ